MFNPEPIFLTGGTGYLGCHLREIFERRSWGVTVFSRPKSTIEPRPNETVQRGDVTEFDTIRPDGHRAVVHLAGFTDVEAAFDEPATAWDVNACGTANMVESARCSNVKRFLNVSSARVYGRPEYLPVDESHPTNPTDPYGASKLAGDRYAAAYDPSYDLSVVTARPFNSFGRGQAKSNVAAVIMTQIQNSDSVTLKELSSARDFLYVKDVASGLETILTEGGSGEIYNVGRGEAISIGEFAELAVRTSNRDLPVETETIKHRSDDVAIPRNFCDSSKLRELGWKPGYSLEDGIQEYLDSVTDAAV